LFHAGREVYAERGTSRSKPKWDLKKSSWEWRFCLQTTWWKTAVI